MNERTLAGAGAAFVNTTCFLPTSQATGQHPGYHDQVPSRSGRAAGDVPPRVLGRDA